MSSKGGRTKRIIGKTAAVLLALLVWQAAAMALNQKILLASPISVAARLGSIWKVPGFWGIIWFSFKRIAAGFLLGLVLGTALAVIAGRFKIVETLLWPYMITIKSVPVASFIVIALVWLSARQLSAFISFLMVLPIIYTNVLSGVKNTSLKMTEMAKVFRLGWGKRMLYINMPQVKPYLLSGMSLSLGLAWKAGVAAEIIGIPDGSLGEMLYESKAYLNTVDLFAWTAIIVLISVLFEKAVTGLAKLCFRGLERL